MVKNSKPKNKQGKKALQRRWFAAMSGWGLNLELGSGDHTQGKVKRSVPVPADTKFSYFTVGLSGLLHLNIYSHNILSGLTQGVTSTQRIGDNIDVIGVSMRVTFDNSTALSTTLGGAFRFVVFASTVQNTNQWFNFPGLISANMFSSSSAGPLSAYPDSRLIRVLCDRVYEYQSRPNSGVILFTEECMLNMPFEYQPTTSVGTAANLYCVLIPWMSGGVVGVSSVGSCSAVVTVAFRDT